MGLGAYSVCWFRHMITIYTGKVGSGKSLKLADTIVGLLARNARWYKKTGILRKIWTNIKISDDIKFLYPDQIEEWTEPAILVKQSQCDIIWDEIATYLDSTQWQNVPLDLKRFLQQHRKRGIDIYGTTQAFGMIDVSMRRLVDSLYVCYKLLGSRNPAPTKPEVKYIWGLIWLSEIDANTFEDVKPKHTGFDWLFMTRGLVNVYDTLQEIPLGAHPALRHIEKDCEDPNCTFKRIIHA